MDLHGVYSKWDPRLNEPIRKAGNMDYSSLKYATYNNILRCIKGKDTKMNASLYDELPFWVRYMVKTYSRYRSR